MKTISLLSCLSLLFLSFSFSSYTFGQTNELNYDKALACIKEAKSKIDELQSNELLFESGLIKEMQVKDGNKMTLNMHLLLKVDENNEFSYLDVLNESGKSFTRQVLTKEGSFNCSLNSTAQSPSGSEISLKDLDLDEMDISNLNGKNPQISFKPKLSSSTRGRSSEYRIDCRRSRDHRGAFTNEYDKMIKAYLKVIDHISKKKQSENYLSYAYKDPLEISNELGYPKECRKISLHYERMHRSTLAETRKALNSLSRAESQPKRASEGRGKYLRESKTTK